ncbi:hypothetical protein DEU56DRAFT_330798 [Suillus clintonianus]|uniref:uncharacterized protein n=1 Tax=Suillus clintonianus TaxID=1904413 RepID=UPI001B88329A|nr:uncharacterized protein DEU56DRAFT_330798 [Suillus clintonianus]KAG2138999.1 hypothetical protein DEU56DRAFT_330798 [Suillus clintonianus]
MVRRFRPVVSTSLSYAGYILDKDQSAFLYESFVRPYIGKAMDGFYEYLKSNNEMFRARGLGRPYYAKFCSIVQSSGTGKSRLMTELRKKGVIVLYMNLREPSDTGFPKRDLVPARILTDYMDCSQAEYTARCCALFAAIFHTLQQDLSPMLPSLGSGSADAAIKSWNDQMCDMRSTARTEFFEKVQSEYQSVLGKIKESGDVNCDAPVVEETAEKLERMSLTGASFVIAAYTEMLKMPHVFPQGDAPKLVIALDEAHPLSKMSSKGFLPFHILGRTINAYCHKNDASVWVVFASTTSQVADFSTPQVIHDSSRVAITGHLLFQPYTYLGWDQNADSLSGISANDVAKFDHIVGFGRPVWKSFMYQLNASGIMVLAARKLCKSKNFNPRDTNEVLAVLSQRFGLDICFGHANAVSYLETGVASHLRVCFSTTEDRSWAFTGYPSEPFLSCVAAILLHGTNINLPDSLKVLKAKVDGGMVETGQSGELASRLLLLLAKDMYVRSHLSEGTISDLYYNGTADAELMDCQKVSVIDFLEYLFGDQFWSNAGMDAKTAFQHAFINFSHWVPMENFISPKDFKLADDESSSARCDAQEWTLRHWHRTSAVQCCHLQPLVDKMIPIYFDDPNLGSNDADRMSQMFVSDKAGKNCNESTLSFITRKDTSIECSSNLPYIALLLDLDVDPKLSTTFPTKVPNPPETDRCLRIYAAGMSDTTFPFLHKHSEVAKLLHGLVSRQQEVPSQSFKRLEALMKFGSTATLRHSRWEAQDVL